jgi:hypothetical protein
METKMKTIAKHTPGPWDVYAGKMKNGDRIINDREGTPVAYAADYNQYAKDDQVDANARLIAAAPELLAAANAINDKLLRSKSEFVLTLAAEIGDLCYAIRKAEGR